MGKYDGRGKNKGKVGHRCRYRDNNEIKDLHGLYEEPKDEYNDDRRDDDHYDGDWEETEEKEWEEDDDEANDVVNITAVQLFGIPDEAFISKEMENNKKEKEEKEKSKGDDNDVRKKSGNGVNRGKKIRGCIDRSAFKGDNEDGTDSWDEHDFGMRKERRGKSGKRRKGREQVKR